MNAPRWIAPSVATATAIVLNLPQFGDSGQDLRKLQVRQELYRPLGDVSKMVVDAFAPHTYLIGQSWAMFSLMSRVAMKLVTDSWSLDAEFARIVDKGFWKLLLR